MGDFRLLLTVAALFLIRAFDLAAQTTPLRMYVNKDSSSYVGVRINGQLWMRYNYNNPGTLISGEEASRFFDISVRRIRFQTYARLNDRTNITLTLGQNNINYLTARTGEIRLLDFYVDHELFPFLTVGGGQSGWNGVSRYASPHTGRMLTLDVPAVAIPTINQTDNLLRKLSAYINGQWKAWDYRVVFSRPYAPVASTQISRVSTFSYVKSGVQTAAYLKYQFFEHESLVSPFHVGTYDGTKKVLALGVGFETQQKAMWHLNSRADTVLTPMNMIAVDLFADIPLPNKHSLTFYSGYFYYDFGPDYIRVIGLNNVGGGVTDNGTFSGAGNAWPAIGTGHIGYMQAGYLLGPIRSKEKWQPFFSAQYAKYDRLRDPVIFWESGINLLLDGQWSKFTLALQNRPIFGEISPGELRKTLRKNTVILQYQLRLE